MIARLLPAEIVIPPGSPENAQDIVNHHKFVTAVNILTVAGAHLQQETSTSYEGR